jgi:hypothetical protein
MVATVSHKLAVWFHLELAADPIPGTSKIVEKKEEKRLTLKGNDSPVQMWIWKKEQSLCQCLSLLVRIFDKNRK